MNGKDPCGTHCSVCKFNVEHPCLTEEDATARDCFNFVVSKGEAHRGRRPQAMNAREKEIRDRLANATKGVWTADGLGSDGSWDVWTMIDDEHYGAKICGCQETKLPAPQSIANARLIAKAKSDIGWLLDQLESARSEERKRTIEACVSVVKDYKNASLTPSALADKIRSLDKRQDANE